MRVRRLRADRKSRNGISIENSKPLERFQINFCRGQNDVLLWSVRSGNKLPRRATGHIFLKDLIGIIQKRNDNIELGEIIHEVLSEFAIACEKSCEGARFDRLDAISQPGCQRKLSDMRVTQHFQMSLGKLPPQSCQRW